MIRTRESKAGIAFLIGFVMSCIAFSGFVFFRYKAQMMGSALGPEEKRALYVHKLYENLRDRRMSVTLSPGYRKNESTFLDLKNLPYRGRGTEVVSKELCPHCDIALGYHVTRGVLPGLFDVTIRATVISTGEKFDYPFSLRSP